MFCVRNSEMELLGIYSFQGLLQKNNICLNFVFHCVVTLLVSYSIQFFFLFPDLLACMLLLPSVPIFFFWVLLAPSVVSQVPVWCLDVPHLEEFISGIWTCLSWITRFVSGKYSWSKALVILSWVAHVNLLIANALPCLFQPCSVCFLLFSIPSAVVCSYLWFVPQNAEPLAKSAISVICNMKIFSFV